MKAKRQLSKTSISLVILSTFLICGIIAGAITASYITADTSNELKSSILSSIESTKILSDRTSLLTGAFVNVFKYPLIVFLLGFTVLGVGLIPIVMSVRGYFLAFAIGATIKLYGINGVWISLAFWGAQWLISIPCLLMIASQSFLAAKAQTSLMSGGKHVIVGSVFSKGHFFVFGICVLFLLILVLIEIFITPHIVSYAFNKML